MNNNALTAMTAGMTRIHSTPITEIEGTPAPIKRPAPAASIPSVTVSLSEDVLGENSKAQQITEKFEQSVAQIYGNGEASQKTKTADTSEAQSLLDMAPLSLPTKADVKAFEDLLNKKLDKAGVDTSIPLKLTINPDGTVQANNDHPDKDKIEALFKENPDLQQGYVKTETYFTMQNIYQLHQQWQQKIEGGMSEEAAGNWLVNSSKGAVANAQVNVQNGRVSGSPQGNQLYS